MAVPEQGRPCIDGVRSSGGLEVGAERDVVAPAGEAFLPAGVRAVGMGVFNARHDLGHVRVAFENVVVDAQVQGLHAVGRAGIRGVLRVALFPLHGVAARRHLVAEHAFPVGRELVGRHDSHAEHVFSPGLHADDVEPCHHFRHQGEIPLGAFPGQGHHVPGSGALVLGLEAVVVQFVVRLVPGVVSPLGEVVGVIQPQAALLEENVIGRVIAQRAGDKAIVLGIEGGFNAVVETAGARAPVAVHPDARRPADLVLLVGIIHLEPVVGFRTELVDQHGAFNGQDGGGGGAVFPGDARLHLAEGVGDGAALVFQIQFIQGIGQVGGVPAVGIRIVAFQTVHAADVPDVVEFEIFQEFHVEPGAEAAPFVVEAASVAFLFPHHAPFAVRVNPVQSVLHAQGDVEFLDVGVFVIPFGIEPLEAVAEPLAGGKTVARQQNVPGGGRGRRRAGKGGGSESHDADDGESIGLHLFSMVGVCL